jgi:hypothetical protein
MNHTIFTVGALSSKPAQLLVDSTVKGTAILVLAAVASLILRRDSAATRYLVWMLAIVAMLVVPVFSAVLPAWRVLPVWAGIPPATTVVTERPASIARPTDGAVPSPWDAKPVEVKRSSAPAGPPSLERPDARLVPVAPEVIPKAGGSIWNWRSALPIVWASGFSVLVLRLLAAGIALWRSERRGMVLWSSTQA